MTPLIQVISFQIFCFPCSVKYATVVVRGGLRLEQIMVKQEAVLMTVFNCSQAPYKSVISPMLPGLQCNPSSLSHATDWYFIQ